ncbi:hypothetical protein DPMN_189972 [Dreissena polymorpha]|uniref:Uncharacterized protein n=1 Tax=Dreissena polymorpha TaxID=45954 RepID=A0A9D4DV16_DREPO|nr:hypothetical protein DPMN_189972 [Dreissena polymorpha]
MGKNDLRTRYNNKGADYRDKNSTQANSPTTTHISTVNPVTSPITTFSNDHINFNNKSSVKWDNKYFTRQRPYNYDSNVARYLNVTDEYSINNFFFVGK